MVRAETPEAAPTATALVEQAAHAYDGNQWDEALRLLARAYELSPRPSIVYNQAQVMRAKGDCAGALDAYARFLATTTPDDPITNGPCSAAPRCRPVRTRKSRPAATSG